MGEDPRSYRLGIDVGGTFTDVVLASDDGDEIHHTKASSTPASPERGALDGTQGILEEANVSPGAIRSVVHGTTVATNAILERTGADTGLLVTRGFRDVLEIRRQNRPHLFDFRDQKEPAVVPRELVREVNERVLPDGTIREELDEAGVREAVHGLVNEGVESIAVGLVHAYVEDAHERRIREIIEDLYPDLKVSISSEVLPEFKEYERISTTAMNAYLTPVMDGYLDRFVTGLDEVGIDAPLTIMQSNGGMMSDDVARTRSVQTVLSGPAAGVVGGQTLTDANSFVTADMGGTSFDVALCYEDDIEFSNETEIVGHVLRVPMIDIETVGAGGGSIAWIDSGGALRVGPRSAGAQPGPAAYGRGGSEPTVTDAHVVLGRLNQEHLLGGEMPVDLDAARRAVRTGVAEPLDLDLDQAAQGILDVVNANLVKSIRVMSVERGYDPRALSLVSFGGAGPMHGVELASELGMAEAVIPYRPGVNSAVGLLAADYRDDHVETYLSVLESADFSEVARLYGEMAAEARATMRAEGIDENAVSVRPEMQLRYHGQGYDLTIPAPVDELDGDPTATIRDRFRRRHEQEYGFVREDETVEVVNLTLSAIGEVPTPDLARGDPAGSGRVDPRSTREVYFGDGWVETPIYDRNDLHAGSGLSGPAVVEQFSSTTVVPPDHRLSVDDYRNLVVRRA